MPSSVTSEDNVGSKGMGKAYLTFKLDDAWIVTTVIYKIYDLCLPGGQQNYSG